MTPSPNQEPLTREALRYELQHYATKEDLRRELQHYATKADVAELKASLIMWMAGLILGGMAIAAAIASTVSRIWGS